MEYTTIWQPLLLITLSLMIGAFFGALWMFYIMHTDNKLLKIDAEINEEKLIQCQKILDQYLNEYEDDGYEAY